MDHVEHPAPKVIDTDEIPFNHHNLRIYRAVINGTGSEDDVIAQKPAAADDIFARARPTGELIQRDKTSQITLHIQDGGEVLLSTDIQHPSHRVIVYTQENTEGKKHSNSIQRQHLPNNSVAILIPEEQIQTLESFAKHLGAQDGNSPEQDKDVLRYLYQKLTDDFGTVMQELQSWLNENPDSQLNAVIMHNKSSTHSQPYRKATAQALLQVQVGGQVRVPA